MTKRNYWLDLFTGANWTEFKAAGAKVSGFRESRWNTVRKMRCARSRSTSNCLGGLGGTP